MGLLLLLLLLPDCGHAAGSELAFMQEPRDTVAVREHPLVLPCQEEGEPPVSISWQRDGLALANDSGLSRFHQHPESVEVERSGVARFQCLIQGLPEPSISWEHNGTALNIANHRVTLLLSGILHITSVSQADVGTYCCVSWNMASTCHSQDAQLTLSMGPPRLLQELEILSGPQNLTLTVHQTTVLECIATGHPQPLVSWSRLGVQLPRPVSQSPVPLSYPNLTPQRLLADGCSTGVEDIQVLGTRNLMISDVSVQHSGVYVCAANRLGTRVRCTAQGVLLVQAPLEFVQWPQSLSKPPGSSAIFTCVAQGVPEPHLVWLKNGKVLSPGDNIRLTHNNRYSCLTTPHCPLAMVCPPTHPGRPPPPTCNTHYLNLKNPHPSTNPQQVTFYFQQFPPPPGGSALTSP
ncbi:hypothetical protein H8959_018561 [Pygathrix nigripes]